MPVQFRTASKQAAKLRMALAGPAGAGKTYTALAVASGLGSPVAVVDTERGSASKYADLFSFDVLELESFHPDRYVEAIHAAQAAGYAVLVIDSLSHAWMGRDGALELVDRAAKRSQSTNSFAAWREVTPSHNAMVDAILGSNLHVIVTLRSKQEYVQEKDERGRTVIRKVGLAPVQRDGLEYEFDVYGDLDQDNTLIVGKTRCPALSGAVLKKPGAALADTLKEWLGGEPVPTPALGVKTKAAASASDVTDAPFIPISDQAPDHDRDLVRSADDPLWQRWLSMQGKAQGLGVKVQAIRLPIDREELKAYGKEIADAVVSREREASAIGATS